MSRRKLDKESRQGKIKESDIRGQIQIDKIFYEEMKMIASENDKSFNALVNELLREYYDEYTSKNSHDANIIKRKAYKKVSDKELKKLDKKCKAWYNKEEVKNISLLWIVFVKLF